MSKLLDLWSDMTGVVLDYALSTPPSDMWMLCFGQALEPGDAKTARLRERLIADDYPYGRSGDDPLLPDVRGRAVAGLDNMGGTAAGRLTSAGGVDASVLGAVGGSQAHTLTEAQMPAHGHSGSAASAGSHGHQMFIRAAGADKSGSSGAFMVEGGGSVYGPSSSSTPSGTNGQQIANSGAHSHSVTISSTGGGQAHPSTQPTIVLNKIIRL